MVHGELSSQINQQRTGFQTSVDRAIEVHSHTKSGDLRRVIVVFKNQQANTKDDVQLSYQPHHKLSSLSAHLGPRIPSRSIEYLESEATPPSLSCLPVSSPISAKQANASPRPAAKQAENEDLLSLSPTSVDLVSAVYAVQAARPSRILQKSPYSSQHKTREKRILVVRKRKSRKTSHAGVLKTSRVDPSSQPSLGSLRSSATIGRSSTREFVQTRTRQAHRSEISHSRFTLGDLRLSGGLLLPPMFSYAVTSAIPIPGLFLLILPQMTQRLGCGVMLGGGYQTDPMVSHYIFIATILQALAMIIFVSTLLTNAASIQITFGSLTISAYGCLCKAMFRLRSLRFSDDNEKFLISTDVSSYQDGLQRDDYSEEEYEEEEDNDKVCQEANRAPKCLPLQEKENIPNVSRKSMPSGFSLRKMIPRQGRALAVLIIPSALSWTFVMRLHYAQLLIFSIITPLLTWHFGTYLLTPFHSDDAIKPPTLAYIGQALTFLNPIVNGLVLLSTGSSLVSGVASLTLCLVAWASMISAFSSLQTRNEIDRSVISDVKKGSSRQETPAITNWALGTFLVTGPVLLPVIYTHELRLENQGLYDFFFLSKAGSWVLGIIVLSIPPFALSVTALVKGPTSDGHFEFVLPWILPSSKSACLLHLFGWVSYCGSLITHFWTRSFGLGVGSSSARSVLATGFLSWLMLITHLWLINFRPSSRVVRLVAKTSPSKIRNHQKLSYRAFCIQKLLSTLILAAGAMFFAVSLLVEFFVQFEPFRIVGIPLVISGITAHMYMASAYMIQYNPTNRRRLRVIFGWSLFGIAMLFGWSTGLCKFPQNSSLPIDHEPVCLWLATKKSLALSGLLGWVAQVMVMHDPVARGKRRRERSIQHRNRKSKQKHLEGDSSQHESKPSASPPSNVWNSIVHICGFKYPFVALTLGTSQNAGFSQEINAIRSQSAEERSNLTSSHSCTVSCGKSSVDLLQSSESNFTQRSQDSTKAILEERDVIDKVLADQEVQYISNQKNNDSDEVAFRSLVTSSTQQAPNSYMPLKRNQNEVFDASDSQDGSETAKKDQSTSSTEVREEQLLAHEGTLQALHLREASMLDYINPDICEESSVNFRSIEQDLSQRETLTSHRGEISSEDDSIGDTMEEPLEEAPELSSHDDEEERGSGGVRSIPPLISPRVGASPHFQSTGQVAHERLVTPPLETTLLTSNSTLQILPDAITLEDLDGASPSHRSSQNDAMVVQSGLIQSTRDSQLDTNAKDNEPGSLTSSGVAHPSHSRFQCMPNPMCNISGDKGIAERQSASHEVLDDVPVEAKTVLPSENSFVDSPQADHDVDTIVSAEGNSSLSSTSSTRSRDHHDVKLPTGLSVIEETLAQRRLSIAERSSLGSESPSTLSGHSFNQYARGSFDLRGSKTKKEDISGKEITSYDDHVPGDKQKCKVEPTNFDGEERPCKSRVEVDDDGFTEGSCSSIAEESFPPEPEVQAYTGNTHVPGTWQDGQESVSRVDKKERSEVEFVSFSDMYPLTVENTQDSPSPSHAHSRRSSGILSLGSNRTSRRVFADLDHDCDSDSCSELGALDAEILLTRLEEVVSSAYEENQVHASSSAGGAFEQVSEDLR